METSSKRQPPTGFARQARSSSRRTSPLLSSLGTEPDTACRPESLEKVSFVLDAGLSALETLQSAGVTMGYGSDLLGQMHGHQSEEFLLRGRVLKPRDVIRSATVDAARVLNMEGLIGTIAPGAHADLIAVYGNPLKDLAILSDPARLRKIIKGG
ncbi:amidohydrolase family protein [Mesorhizobium sp.]|nr:amidohydrolase family protein [Mesorhizobium sp.]